MTSRLVDEPRVVRLPDGRRIRLMHGPIDLVIEAQGDDVEVRRAYHQAATAFRSTLAVLASELGFLRSELLAPTAPPAGPVAQRMAKAAVRFHLHERLTPMIAVAGAVADHVLAAMTTDRTLERAYVNNGGDIALHLDTRSDDFPAPRFFDIGICSNPTTRDMPASVRIRACSPVRGLATSGWQGRSHSLGIADAVTVLARDAASADAAATLIANAIDLPGHANIARVPACTLSSDSDLGDRLVTHDVGPLSPGECRQALDTGLTRARTMINAGQIDAVYAIVQGEWGSALASSSGAATGSESLTASGPSFTFANGGLIDTGDSGATLNTPPASPDTRTPREHVLHA